MAAGVSLSGLIVPTRALRPAAHAGADAGDRYFKGLSAQCRALERQRRARSNSTSRYSVAECLQAWNARPPPPPVHPVEALPGPAGGAKAPAGRGPAPRLLQHRERISAQPKTQQRLMTQMIETVLAQQER